MIYTNNKKMQMSGKEKQAFMDKIEKKSEQQLIRSARFYTNHKDKVLEKHKQNRIKEREILTKLEQEIATQFKAKKTEQPPTAQLQKNEPLPKNTFDYTQKDIVNALKNLKSNAVPKDTIKTYITGINRIYRLTGCDKIYDCLKNPPKLIDIIENGLQKNGKPYALNSTVGTYQVVLFVIDHLLGPEAQKDAVIQNAHAEIKKMLDRYKIKAGEQTETKKSDNDFAVPTFDEYLKRCLEKFGRDSKQYLIAFLYSLFTVRDNLHHLIFVTSMDETDNERNFFINNDKETTFVINDFKTKKRRHKSRIVWTVPVNTAPGQELENLLGDYFEKKKIAEKKYVFGASPLTKFVGDMNRALGYADAGGVNLFRHMRVSTFMKGNPTFEQREALADEMGHSLITQTAYTRNIIVTEEKE